MSRSTLSPGDTIVHATFKLGTITSMDERGIAKVRFDEVGEKTINTQPPYDRHITEVNGQPFVPAPPTVPVAPNPRTQPSSQPDSSRGTLRIDEAQPVTKPHIWWANQGATYEVCKQLSCLWAPLRSSDDRSLWYWDTMAEARVGDIVVHYASGEVRALGRVIAQARETAQPPASLPIWKRYSRGRHVGVEYYELDTAIPMKSVAPNLLNLNIEQGPLNQKGGVQQIYLARFTIAGLRILRQHSAVPWPEWAEAALR